MESVSMKDIKFDEKGLVPAVVQEGCSGKVLMVAYMNAEALKRTVESGDAWYYSRSRQELWHKGETSGHFQHVRSIAVDCDADTILLTVDQVGAACHTGHKSCFFRSMTEWEKTYTGNLSMLSDLREEIKICKKIGEESSEVIIAAKNADTVVNDTSEAADNLRLEVCKESADLLYHLSVLWEDTGVTVNDVMKVLEERSHVKGNKKTVGHLDKTF